MAESVENEGQYFSIIPGRSKERIVYVELAKVALEAGQHDHMAQIVLHLALLHKELTEDECGLFYCAFDNVTQARVTSWRIIKNIEAKEGTGSAHRLEMIRDSRKKIEGELLRICSDIMRLLDVHMIPYAVNKTAKDFYYKMRGDCLEDQCLILSGRERERAKCEQFNSWNSCSQTPDEVDAGIKYPEEPVTLECFARTMSQPDLTKNQNKSLRTESTAEAAARLSDVFNSFVSFLDHYNNIQFKNPAHVSYLFTLAHNLENTAKAMVEKKCVEEFNGKLAAYLKQEKKAIYNLDFFTRASDRLLEAFLLEFYQVDDDSRVVACENYLSFSTIESFYAVLNGILSDGLLIERIHGAIGGRRALQDAE